MARPLPAPDPEPIYAVLTGDLVRSQAIDAEALDRVRQALALAVEELNRARPGLVLGQPQFFRGDAWQMLLTEPGAFLRVAVYLRARLRALDAPADTRIAVGLGAVERLDPEQVSRSIGEAFTLSGHTLDRMRKRREIWVGLPGGAEARVAWLSPVLALCGVVVDRWKPRQAAAVSQALLAEAQTQGDIARQSQVTRQAVNRALVTAGWPAVQEAIDLVEATDWPALVRAGR